MIKKLAAKDKIDNRLLLMEKVKTFILGAKYMHMTIIFKYMGSPWKGAKCIYMILDLLPERPQCPYMLKQYTSEPDG